MLFSCPQQCIKNGIIERHLQSHNLAEHMLQNIILLSTHTVVFLPLIKHVGFQYNVVS